MQERRVVGQSVSSALACHSYYSPPPLLLRPSLPFPIQRVGEAEAGTSPAKRGHNLIHQLQDKGVLTQPCLHNSQLQQGQCGTHCIPWGSFRLWSFRLFIYLPWGKPDLVWWVYSDLLSYHCCKSGGTHDGESRKRGWIKETQYTPVCHVLQQPERCCAQVGLGSKYMGMLLLYHILFVIDEVMGMISKAQRRGDKEISVRGKDSRSKGI